MTTRALARAERERIRLDALGRIAGAGKDLASEILRNPMLQAIGGLALAQYLMNRRYDVEDWRNIKVVDEAGHWGMGTGLWGLPQFMWIPERYHYEKQFVGTAHIPVLDETAGRVLQASLASQSFLSAIGGITDIVAAFKGVAK